MDQPPPLLFEIQAEPFEYGYGFWISGETERADLDLREVVWLPDGTPWIMIGGDQTLIIEMGEYTSKTLRFYNARPGCFDSTYTHVTSLKLTVPAGNLWVGDIIYDVDPDQPTYPPIQVKPTATVDIYTDLHDWNLFYTNNKTYHICFS